MAAVALTRQIFDVSQAKWKLSANLASLMIPFCFDIYHKMFKIQHQYQHVCQKFRFFCSPIKPPYPRSIKTLSVKNLCKLSYFL